MGSNNFFKSFIARNFKLGGYKNYYILKDNPEKLSHAENTESVRVKRRGYKGEPYCSTDCGKKGKEISDIFYESKGNRKGVCSICQSPNIILDKVFPYSKKMFVYCDSCEIKANKFINLINKCCLCGKLLTLPSKIQANTHSSNLTTGMSLYGERYKVMTNPIKEGRAGKCPICYFVVPLIDAVEVCRDWDGVDAYQFYCPNCYERGDYYEGQLIGSDDKSIIDQHSWYYDKSNTTCGRSDSSDSKTSKSSKSVDEIIVQEKKDIEPKLDDDKNIKWTIQDGIEAVNIALKYGKIEPDEGAVVILTPSKEPTNVRLKLVGSVSCHDCSNQTDFRTSEIIYSLFGGGPDIVCSSCGSRISLRSSHNEEDNSQYIIAKRFTEKITGEKQPIVFNIKSVKDIPI